ncbi:hypothetical protein EC968_010216 [Mortierella alpina]|nr:hypothetical protein EC968_010216 [Mortierella alpina]
MGVQDLWPLVRRKGYDPATASLPQQQPLLLPGKIRVDVSSCLFASLQRSYSTYPPNEAAAHFERALNGLVGHLKSSVVCYLDGKLCQEKAATHAARDAKRRNALESTNDPMDALRDRVRQRRPATKQQHLAVKKVLRNSFRTSEEDVVLTKDCDFLAFEGVKTIWRLVTKSKLLVYKVPDLLKATGLTRIQLTALCVVSKNDYDSNIERLGTTTNYKILKSITGNDVQQTVEQYRRHQDVVRRDNNGVSFEYSRRVYVAMEQTETIGSSSSELNNRHHTLHSEYEQLRTQLQVISQEARALRQQFGAITDTGWEPRHAPWQRFNRFRTIDRPANLKAGPVDTSVTPSNNPNVVSSSLPISSALQSTLASARPMNSNSNEMLKDGPAAPQSVRDQPRSRFSAKIRQRSAKSSGPPQVMKLYKWKPHQPKPDSDDPSGRKDTNGSSKRTPKRPAKKKKKKKDDDETPWKWTLSKDDTVKKLEGEDWTKRETLLRLYKEHPRATLRVGTLTANVRGVCDEHAREVTKSLREAIKIITDVKQQAQELIGQFIQLVVVKAFEDGHSVSNDDRELLDAICPRIAKSEPKDDTEVSDHTEEDEDEDEKEKSLQYQFLYKLLTHLFSGNVTNKNPTGKLVQKFVNRASELELCEPFSTAPIRKQVPFPASVLWSVTQELAKEIKMHHSRGCETIQNKDLLSILWKNDILKARIMRIFEMSRASKDVAAGILSTKGPGFLLNHLITRKGTGGPRRGHDSYQKTAKTFSIGGMKTHLAGLWSKEFKDNPTTYDGRGYMLTGSFRTDGFSLQILALKLKECSSVKYKRLPEYVDLPPRMLSVMSGIDDHLTEIRNVPLLELLDMSQEDVRVQGVTKLGIDLGQKLRQRQKGAQPTYINLAVKSKAVLQPTFKKRAWLEAEKNTAVIGPKSINDLELSIPPRHGQDTDFVAHVNARRETSGQLRDFYSSPRMMSREYDARRAHEGEYSKITDQLLRMVGGTIGRPKDADAKIVIGVGLSKFGSGSGLTSMDQAFASYFIRTCRALGYLVVGLNEFYTSKKCPDCHNFAAQVTLRQLYCPHCRVYFHRDVMAGNNLCNVIDGHLLTGHRPQYLQLVNVDGGYPWMYPEPSTSISNSIQSSTSSLTRKRPAGH